jgi:hypothetical protein
MLQGGQLIGMYGQMNQAGKERKTGETGKGRMREEKDDREKTRALERDFNGQKLINTKLNCFRNKNQT